MTKSEVLGYAANALAYADYEIVSQQIPAPGTYSGATISGMSVISLDLEDNIEFLQSTVYGDVSYNEDQVPSEEASAEEEEEEEEETPEPSPSEKAEASAKPKTTVSPKPSATAKASATPKPSAAAKSSATPKPSASKTASAAGVAQDRAAGNGRMM